jgi:hypothetical protein
MDEDEIENNSLDDKKTFRGFYERIGYLVTAFAGLEIELINGLGLLINDGNLQIGEIVAGKLSFAATVDLFEELALYSLTDQKAQRELDALVKKLRCLGTLRNQIVHADLLQICETSDDSKHLEGLFVRQHVRQRSRRKVLGAVQSDPSALLDQAEHLISTLFDELALFTQEYLC